MYNNKNIIRVCLFFIWHFRQCFCDKSVTPRGIFFFPPAAPTERLAHNSNPEASREAVCCSWVHPSLCIHACQKNITKRHKKKNLGLARVKELPSKSSQNSASYRKRQDSIQTADGASNSFASFPLKLLCALRSSSQCCVSSGSASNLHHKFYFQPHIESTFLSVWAKPRVNCLNRTAPWDILCELIKMHLQQRLTQCVGSWELLWIHFLPLTPSPPLRVWAAYIRCESGRVSSVLWVNLRNS